MLAKMLRQSKNIRWVGRLLSQEISRVGKCVEGAGILSEQFLLGSTDAK
jgi:hypothetical protein